MKQCVVYVSALYLMIYEERRARSPQRAVGKGYLPDAPEHNARNACFR